MCDKRSNKWLSFIIKSHGWEIGDFISIYVVWYYCSITAYRFHIPKVGTHTFYPDFALLAMSQIGGGGGRSPRAGVGEGIHRITRWRLTKEVLICYIRNNVKLWGMGWHNSPWLCWCWATYLLPLPHYHTEWKRGRRRRQVGGRGGHPTPHNFKLRTTNGLTEGMHTPSLAG